MFRILVLMTLCLLTPLSFSQSTRYQVDLIIFTHHASSLKPLTNTTLPMLSSTSHNAIALRSSANATRESYQILPTSASQLRQEYWTLSHKPEYQIIANYSWIQPSNNQRAVELPQQTHAGWNLEGTLRIRQSNYYLLDTELLFTAQSSQPTAFLFSQQQRLKPGTTYYLDHPHAGMLIKVHQVA